MTRQAAVVIALSVAMSTAGCGSSGPPKQASASGLLDFAYDASAPLGFVDRGRINAKTYPIAIHDISYRSGGHLVPGYLLEPPGSGRRPAVIFIHGSGGDRSELLAKAAWLAARNVVTLTITLPSTAVQSTPKTVAGLLAQSRSLTVGDVVAVRRAVDLLQSLPIVDPQRIGYLGWSGGARLGTFVAASEPRVKAVVLLSAGADLISAYAAQAPLADRPEVRRVLGSIDPLRYIATARAGSVLLEDGRKDRVVPREALQNIVRAAPTGTIVHWYPAPHALDNAAYHDAFNWFAQKLPIDGPSVPGAATESSG